MRISFLWLLLLPVAAVAQDQACNQGDLADYWSVGMARAANGELLYCEFHQQEDSENHTVIYRAPGGQIIAEKTILWDASRTRPQIVQQDLRTGERILVERGEEWRLIYQEKADAPVEQVTLALNEVDVVDAGFDQKVRDHWDGVVGGDRLRVMFAAPALQRVVPLRVTRRGGDRCAHAKEEGSTCFWVEADNALVRLFVDPLRLTYDQQRRLRAFEGVVNIRDGEGKKQEAVILYRYVGE